MKKAPAPRPSFILHPSFSSLRAGYTLVEILIVVGIIVLLLALAVPAFNLIRGGRSIEAGENQISAMLARARSRALGLQETTGAFFFLDPATQRHTIALVRDSGEPPTTEVDLFLDLVTDHDFLPMPWGVGAQLMIDIAPTGERYLGYNKDLTKVSYGGVILFDPSGRLVVRRYAFRTAYEGPDGNIYLTPMGQLLWQASATDFSEQRGDFPPYPGAKSSVGLVLFDREVFNSLDFDEEDPIATPGTTYIPAEEQWLDEHGIPLLVNRYNGTLIRSD